MADLAETYESVPSGFAFASESQYAASLLQGVSSVAEDAWSTYADGGLFTPPIAAQVGTIVATWEETTGISIGQLAELAGNVVALANADVPSEVVQATSDLVYGLVDIGISVAQAAGVAVEALDAIPLLGDLIGLMTLFMVEVLKSSERYDAAQAQCQQRASLERDQFCRDLMRRSIPRSTGYRETTGVTLDPTDLFRPLAYQWWRSGTAKLVQQPGTFYGQAPKWQLVKPEPEYPANAASLYLALCGGEAQDFSVWNGETYRAACKHLGVPIIPQATQRKMWTLIKALMAGARDPRPQPGKSIPKPDGGRAVMPILMDLVNNERHRGRITPELLARAQEEVFAWTSKTIKCKDLVKGEIAAGATPHGWGWCADRIDLVTSFWDGLNEYDIALRHNFVKGDAWTIGPARGGGSRRGRAPARITLGSRAVQSLNRLLSSQRRGFEVARKKRILVAGSAMAVGAGAVWGILLT